VSSLKRYNEKIKTHTEIAKKTQRTQMTATALLAENGF